MNERFIHVSYILQTSNTTLWTLYSLAKNPHVQKQLYEEVSSVLQPDELATPATLHKMPFLRGCIKETLRYGTISIANMKTLFTSDKNSYALICTVLSSIFSFSPVGYTAGGNERQKGTVAKEARAL